MVVVHDRLTSRFRHSLVLAQVRVALSPCVYSVVLKPPSAQFPFICLLRDAEVM
jgi:hypothetical protein